MQTHTIYSYQFPELSDEAREAAIDWVRNHWHDLYSWGDENAASLKSFCEHFNLSTLDWSVSPYSYSYATANIHEDLEELTGVRLWKYLNNSGLLDNSLLSGECPFTGYCFDENLLDPMREFIKKPDTDQTYQDLINACLSSWVRAYVSDWEYQYSDEGLKEFILANEYQFTDDGKFYC